MTHSYPWKIKILTVDSECLARPRLCTYWMRVWYKLNLLSISSFNRTMCYWKASYLTTKLQSGISSPSSATEVENWMQSASTFKIVLSSLHLPGNWFHLFWTSLMQWIVVGMWCSCQSNHWIAHQRVPRDASTAYSTPRRAQTKFWPYSAYQ